MSVTTSQDAITAAMSLAEDVAAGKVDPTQLERQAVAELSALMLIEPEPGSELAAVQIESARRVLARGDLPADELAEWAAVARRRADGADMPTEG